MLDYNKVREYYNNIVGITDTYKEFEVALLLAERGYMVDDIDEVTEAEMEAVSTIAQNCETLFDEYLNVRVDEIINYPRNNY